MKKKKKIHSNTAAQLRSGLLKRSDITNSKLKKKKKSIAIPVHSCGLDFFNEVNTKELKLILFLQFPSIFGSEVRPFIRSLPFPPRVTITTRWQ